jgi:hypothetical protein
MRIVRRLLGSRKIWLHASIALAVVAATVTGFAAPASAADDSTCYTNPVDSRAFCMTGGSITSAATGKYVETGSDGTLDAGGTVHGWSQHVQFDYLGDWTQCDWFALEFPARNRLTSSSSSGGVLIADSTFIGWNQAFQIVRLGGDEYGQYYGIKHLASGKWLSAGADGRLRADTTFVGWNQAFRIPVLDSYYGIYCEV